jgi:hypothetical protein
VTINTNHVIHRLDHLRHGLAPKGSCMEASWTMVVQKMVWMVVEASEWMIGGPMIHVITTIDTS